MPLRAVAESRGAGFAQLKPISNTPWISLTQNLSAELKEPKIIVLEKRVLREHEIELSLQVEILDLKKLKATVFELCLGDRTIKECDACVIRDEFLDRRKVAYRALVSKAC